MLRLFRLSMKLYLYACGPLLALEEVSNLESRITPLLLCVRCHHHTTSSSRHPSFSLLAAALCNTQSATSSLTSSLSSHLGPLYPVDRIIDGANSSQQLVDIIQSTPNSQNESITDTMNPSILFGSLRRDIFSCPRRYAFLSRQGCY